ncbi:ilvGMEDA operon leader peptide [Colwellia psychrerythraea 34H]|uniref:IlvGMEDA operon leader peptide n=1 Tax=Colwellia psychrerythraea (strain 34H / ATCC BAA-681) TaxID=167879 RepID=Q47UP1_COLP3|nr:ilvGMEDA operon leader peptide [Colwellia psychrerythraea 34H]
MHIFNSIIINLLVVVILKSSRGFC